MCGGWARGGGEYAEEYLTSNVEEYDVTPFFLFRLTHLDKFAKVSLTFSTKNISVFSNKVVKPFNELVKLTML